MADTQTNNSSRKPTHTISYVRGEGKKAYWIDIGAGWLHKDQKGMSLKLNLIPRDPDADIVIRAREEKSAEGSEQSQQAA